MTRYDKFLKMNRFLGKCTGNINPDSDVRSEADILDIMRNLHRYETTLSTINEKVCSYEMDEKESQRLERKEQNTENKVRAALERINPDIQVRFQGDPRGHAIQIIFPGSRDPLSDYMVIDW